MSGRDCHKTGIDITYRLVFVQSKKQKKIDLVVDKIKEKYGYETITRAGKMNMDKNIKFK